MQSYWHSISVLPDDLIAFAWSMPMRDLAAQLKISDVGLRKQLTSMGIPLPPQGHWNKVHAGKAVASHPKAPARRPGSSGRLRVDERFSRVVASASPMSSAGPFVSAATPEDLGELLTQERKAIGRVTVPKSLDRHHSGLATLIRKEDQRRQKDLERTWNYDHPRFDNPLDRRKLRIFNALFLALAKRGAKCAADDDNGRIASHATVGDTFVPITLSPTGKHRTTVAHGYPPLPTGSF